MIKEKYEKWIKEFMESWKELDYQRTLQTLSKDVLYYENPIDSPCRNFNEKTCIINFQMIRTMTSTNKKQEIDGIFQISLF